MRAIDRFGVLKPSLGQVKNCPLFQSSAAPTPGIAPPATLPGTPPPAPPVALPPTPLPTVPAKGVSLTANVTNTQGETARGIILNPTLDPVYLMATVFGILAGAPASASDPAEIKTYSLPMMLGPNDPAVTPSLVAMPRPGYSHKVWFFKIDKSPVTFSLSPADMVDQDGTPMTAVVFQFPQVGSFYVTPPVVVLQDGQNETMSFTVKTATDSGMGSRVRRTIPLLRGRF